MRLNEMCVAPFGGVEEMVKDLKTKVFPERKLRDLQVVPKARFQHDDGQRTMKVT